MALFRTANSGSCSQVFSLPNIEPRRPQYFLYYRITEKLEMDEDPKQGRFFYETKSFKPSHQDKQLCQKNIYKKEPYSYKSKQNECFDGRFFYGM